MGFGMEYLSEKAMRYILHPYRIRKKWNYINPGICGTLTAQGENNLIGTFISPDIEDVYEANNTTFIVLKVGGGNSLRW